MTTNINRDAQLSTIANAAYLDASASAHGGLACKEVQVLHFRILTTYPHHEQTP